MISGIISESNNKNSVVEEDNTIIYVISDLSIHDITESSITIKWSKPIPSTDVNYIKLYINGQLSTNIDATLDEWLISDLNKSTYYSIYITVVNNDGQEGSPSNIVSQVTKGDDINLDLPQYAIDAIYNANQDAKTIDPNNQFFKFIFTTDTHNSNDPKLIPTRGNNLNSEKSVVSLSQIGTYNAVIFGGDMHDANNCEKDEAMSRIATVKELTSKIPVDTYYVRGNHDVNFRAKNNPEQHRIESDEFFDIYNNNDVPKVVDPKYPKGGWFYRDYDDYNIRLIVLNNCNVKDKEFGVGEGQYDFLENVMLDTTKEVLIFQHNFAPGSSIQGPLKWFVRRGGRVILVMGGHLHQDRHWINPYGFQTTLTNAGLNLLSQEGTIEEIAFDSCVIDHINKKVYLHRVGRGEHRIINY